MDTNNQTVLESEPLPRARSTSRLIAAPVAVQEPSPVAVAAPQTLPEEPVAVEFGARLRCNNEAVASFAMIAKFHGMSERHLQRLFMEDADEFKEGVHYYRAKSNDIKAALATASTGDATGHPSNDIKAALATASTGWSEILPHKDGDATLMNEHGYVLLAIRLEGPKAKRIRKAVVAAYFTLQAERKDPELAVRGGVKRGVEACMRLGMTKRAAMLRVMGIVERLSIMGVCKAHELAPTKDTQWQFGAITNLGYKTLTGMDAKQWAAFKGLKKGQNLRDYMDEIELHSILMLENIAAQLIEQGKLRGYSQIRGAIIQAAKIVQPTYVAALQALIKTLAEAPAD